MRIDLFQSCGHYWVFQICWHTECNTLISSFRVLNSSNGIPPHPLALLTAVLPKALLTSHYRISGSGWLTTQSWLSSSLTFFCTILPCILSISSWSLLLLLGLYHLSFIVPIFEPNVPLIFLIFPKRSLVFPLQLFSPIFMHCSLKKACLSLAFLWNSVFSWVYLSHSPMLFTSPLSSAICKASSDNHFAFLLFFFFGMVYLLPPLQFYGPPSIVQVHCLLDLIPWIYSLPPLHIDSRFDLSHTWLV